MDGLKRVNREQVYMVIIVFLASVVVTIIGISLVECTESLRIFGWYQMVNNIDVEKQEYIDKVEEGLSRLPVSVIEAMQKKKCRVVLLKGHCNHDYYIASDICNYDMVNKFVFDYREGTTTSLILGCYHAPRKLIYVFTDEAELVGDIRHTLVHEVGHFVWEEVLSKTERQQISDILRDGEKREFVSTTGEKYAGTSINECFAEIFSSYYNNEFEDLWDKGLCDKTTWILNNVLGEKK